MRITFGLVVYNEEKVIRRCLDSIRDVADEIIIIHDGECTDETLRIAKEYTPKVYVLEHLGGSDPHRIRLLQEARNDWVFMIDADEFLSPGLKDFLKNATVDTVYGAYAFKWPLWNGTRYVTHSNYRACLFYRPQTWAIGLHNFSLQTNAPVKKIDVVLEHQPFTNKVSFSRFSGQLGYRIERDARQFLQGYDALPKFNEPLIPLSFQRWYRDYLAHPRRYSYIQCIKFFIGALKTLWKDGYYGVIVSVQSAVYQYKLAQRVAALQIKSP